LSLLFQEQSSRSHSQCSQVNRKFVLLTSSRSSTLPIVPRDHGRRFLVTTSLASWWRHNRSSLSRNHCLLPSLCLPEYPSPAHFSPCWQLCFGCLLQSSKCSSCESGKGKHHFGLLDWLLFVSCVLWRRIQTGWCLWKWHGPRGASVVDVPRRFTKFDNWRVRRWQRGLKT